MSLYNLLAGIVFIACGTYVFLLYRGRLEINAKDPEKSREWREKYSPVMKWAGPILVIFGVLHLVGFL
jgi:hypothetical protein